MNSSFPSKRDYQAVGGALLIVVAVAVLTGYVHSRLKIVTVVNETTQLALQHVERGDIVEFGGDDFGYYFQMVESRVGNFIFFKVPTCSGISMEMDIESVALQATEVIKYNSTSVAWTNAAYMLMTGYRPSVTKKSSK